MADAEIIPLDPARRRPGRRPGHRRTQPKAAPAGLSIAQALESWKLACASKGLQEGTMRSYRDAVADFAAWLSQHEQCVCGPGAQDRGCPVTRDGKATCSVPAVDEIHADLVRRFLTHERLRTSPGNAFKFFRVLRTFFRWLIKEGHVQAPGPVDNDDAPNVPERELPPFSDDEIRKLLKTCKAGTAFEDYRDYAIMRILMDIGPRVSGLAGVKYIPGDPDANDVMLSRNRIRIRLKGGDVYEAPIGKKAAAAIDRYLRKARILHPDADEPWLWLGRWGHLKESGIQQMLGRRGERAGVHNVGPHRFRRSAATEALEAGESETDVMHNMGWKTPDMVRRYTKATAKDRARRNHVRISPADRF